MTEIAFPIQMPESLHVGVCYKLLILFTYFEKYTQVFWIKSLYLWTEIKNRKALETEMLPQIENLNVSITFAWSADRLYRSVLSYIIQTHLFYFILVYWLHYLELFQ